MTTADTATTAFRDSTKTNQAALARLHELRGLLESYVAIAGPSLESDEKLRRLYADARDNLYESHSDLASGAEQVKQFADAVRKGK
jgi:hypothetical protein